MNNPVKILICCASGSGTSMLMKLTVERACKAAGLKASVYHCPIAEGKSSAKQYDLVLTSPNFLNMFDAAKAAGVKVCGLKNPLSDGEVLERLKESGFVEG